MMKRSATTILAVCLMMATGVRAASVTWIGPADGDWNTATNWTTGYVPGSTAADTAIWNNSLTGNVTTAVAPTNNVNLTMRNGGVLNIFTNMDLAAMNIGTTGNGAAIVNHTAGAVVGNSFTAGLPGGALLASYTVSGSAALTTLNDLTLQSNSLFTVSGSGASVQVGNGSGDDLIMDGNGGLKFVFDATGVSAINVHNNFSIDATNALLTIDASAYTNGAATFDLVNYGNTNIGTFATNNITIIGAKVSVGYDATGMFMNLVPYGPGDTLLIGQDDFDGEGVYSNRTIVGGINTAPGTTWAIVSRGTIQYPGMIDTSVAAGGVVTQNVADVLGFLGTNKTDNIFGMYRAGTTPKSLTYTFDIAGYTNLNLLVDWATSGSYFQSKDVSMTYSIDGGATNTILDIGLSTNEWTETMDNGTELVRPYKFPVTVNGVVSNSLTDEFQTYNPVIDGTGSNLTLIIVMESGVGGYGGMGMDNLKLYGTIPEPPSLEIGNMSISPLPGGTQVALSWLTEAGYSYGVQARSSLQFGSWGNIITNVPGTGSSVTVTNSISPAAEFYRAYLEE